MIDTPSSSTPLCTFDLVATDDALRLPGDPLAQIEITGSLSGDLAVWLRLNQRDADAQRRTDCLMRSLLMMMHEARWHPSLPHCRGQALRFAMIVDGESVAIVASVPPGKSPVALHVAIDDHGQN